MKIKLLLFILFLGLQTTTYADYYAQSSNSIPSYGFDLDVSISACDDGDAKECANLGLKYIEGSNEIEKNYKKAKLFAKKACQYKNRLGCMLLLNIDEAQTRDLLNKACTDGNNTACIDLQILKDKKYYIVDGKCSRCGSTHIGNYLYGLVDPDKKMQKKIDNGEIVLGGCIVSKDSPKHYCSKCGVDLYIQTTKGNHNKFSSDTVYSNTSKDYN